MTTTSSVTSSTDAASIIQSYIDKQTAAQKAADTSKTSSSSSSSSVTGLATDFNTFIKILTTQLQNQDPTDATDVNQFTQELVQFAGVEQQLSTNDKLDKLIDLTESNGITPLLSYVGKTVETSADNKIVLQSSTANFSYSLDSEAASVTITVKDTDGNVIAKMNGPTSSGTSRVSWDGVGSDGKTVEDGVYKVSVSATDSSGKIVDVGDVNLIGAVTAIRTNSDGTTTLSVGDLSLDAGDVTAVYSGITLLSSSSSSTTDTSTSDSSTAGS